MEESNEVVEEKEESHEVEKGEGKKRRTKDSILQYIISSCGYFVREPFYLIFSSFISSCFMILPQKLIFFVDLNYSRFQKPGISEVPLSLYATALKALANFEEKVLLHSTVH